MFSAQRRTKILEFIKQEKHVGVTQLLQRFDVSAATIRRDLSYLQTQGTVRRARGGAVLEQRSFLDLSYQARENQFIQTKIRIARDALQFIDPGDAVFLNDGTTIMHLAREIAQRDIPITAITNSIKVAEILLLQDNVELILIGGNLKEFSYACSGPFAELTVDSLNANKAIISPDAIHPRRAASIQHLGEASITRKMISKSDKCIVVGDSSKMNRVATVTICQWEDIDIFITDFIEPAACAEIQRHDVLIVCSEDN